jgi:hypothetical protein
MDPLSAVASIFAVLSLTLQVCESVTRLKRFLSNISNASSIVVRLRDRLILLANLSTHVRSILERRVQAPFADTQAHACVYSALYACQRSLDLVESELLKCNKFNDAKAPVLRGWYKCQLVRKREKFKELENYLQQAFSDLNLTLTLCLL